MRAPPWKTLVRELADSGFESPYLDRLKRKIDIELGAEELEKEIVQEMASALGRSGDKVDLALLRLDVVARAIDNAQAPAERRKRVSDWNAAREEAIEARYELRIHREAVGIRSNRVLESIYPIPPRRSFVPD
ncbi:MAG: hypothetical protein P8R42_00630 [Candidatus Binatia bacterium]|nr:hypothetical protein [Candidatus Binatia bacterium]